MNARQFGFRFPFWQEMMREGLPVEGVFVAAGIPQYGKAAEIISAIRDTSIQHVAFKPGSIE
jgi:fatty acid synthase subunit beta